MSGSPAASACACSNSWRTACMATRLNSALTVVTSAATSMSGSWRRRCSVQALSLPLLQESATRGRDISEPKGLLSARGCRGAYPPRHCHHREAGGDIEQCPGQIGHDVVRGACQIIGKRQAGEITGEEIETGVRDRERDSGAERGHYRERCQ